MCRHGTPDHTECRNSAGDRVPVTRWGFFGKTMQGISDLQKRGYHERKCESATAAVVTPASLSTTVKSDDILLCPPKFCKQQERHAQPLESG